MFAAHFGPPGFQVRAGRRRRRSAGLTGEAVSKPGRGGPPCPTGVLRSGQGCSTEMTGMREKMKDEDLHCEVPVFFWGAKSK